MLVSESVDYPDTAGQILRASTEQDFALAGDTSDSPEEQGSYEARNGRWERSESLGRASDKRDLAPGVEREEIQRGDDVESFGPFGVEHALLGFADA